MKPFRAYFESPAVLLGVIGVLLAVSGGAVGILVASGGSKVAPAAPIPSTTPEPARLPSVPNPTATVASIPAPVPTLQPIIVPPEPPTSIPQVAEPLCTNEERTRIHAAADEGRAQANSDHEALTIGIEGAALDAMTRTRDAALAWFDTAEAAALAACERGEVNPPNISVP